jgi:iron complex outermembrane receptor protein
MSQHSSFRRFLKTGTAIGVAVSFAIAFEAPHAAAQDAPAADTTEVVVTGTRAPRRSRLDTLAPVDVIKFDSLNAQASPELAQGLSQLAPSIDFPRPAVTDGTDSIRPVTLRGLSPDQALVLVNGKRAHASALVNINGSVGRGSAAVDLNTIPESALSTVEILRDGASAQYGSDAIAGVVNLRLRAASHGGNISASYGQYDTDVKTATTSYHKSDGATSTLSGWIGLPLGHEGFVTISGELKDRRPTSRGGLDYRVTPAAVTSRFGDPAERSTTAYINAGAPINAGWTFYGWGSLQNRYDQSAANFRQPGNSGNVLSVYPNGFLPMIDVHSKDYSYALGVKGEIAGWASDFSVTVGNNKIHYVTAHSINASFGAASKTGFYSGELQYGQGVIDADFSRSFEVGLAAPLDVAFGFEGRSESYAVRAGELQSYATGTAGPAGTPAGAQGFPGLYPENANDKERSNIGAYVDVETRFTDKFSVGGAIRTESYSDFGENTSGKLSARYDFTPAFAIRGSYSTGFRAPSLQQQYFSSSATNFISGVPVLITTFPVSNPVAKALGATDLKPEKSDNSALGFVYHKGPFELTVDGYQIKIKDRIILSENLLGSSNAGVAGLLAPFPGVGGARFFMNGVDTTTKGVDVVAHYHLATSSAGTWDFGLAYNHGTTDIDRFPAINTLSTLPVPPALFARVNQNLLASATPEDKYTLSADWHAGNWAASASAVSYSSVLSAQTNAALDFSTGDKTVVNLSASYKLPAQTVWSIGVDNAFDVYPNTTPLITLAGSTTLPTTPNYNGAPAWSTRSPFGFNGRYIYTKISKSF